MTITEIKPDIYSISIKDWDRRLFDELIPLPDGTSYNAYFINGSAKTALIDTADPRKEEQFLQDIKELKIGTLDFIITNHSEPDHSGCLSLVLEQFPDAKIMASPKGKEILIDLLLLPPENLVTVNDGDTISLGNKTLEFISAPWVHWPETMFTYLREDKLLFSCDFLGNHIASSEVFANDNPKVYSAAKRYYAEIMMPFRYLIQKHLDRLTEFEIEVIATSHGQIYNNPDFILSSYKDWVSDSVANEVVIPYVSMYGSSEQLVMFLIEELTTRGIVVKPFNLTATDIGELAMALVDAATIVIGSPTVLTGAHPAVVYAAYLANLLRPKAKFASVIGSYGWQSRLAEKITSLLGNLKVEVLDPVIIKGKPSTKALEEIRRLADDIAAKHKELGILEDDGNLM